MAKTRISYFVGPVVAGSLMATLAGPAEAGFIDLGPANPTLDDSEYDPYNAHWNFSGYVGGAWGDTTNEGGYVPDTGRLNLGATSTDNAADIRSDTFALNEAAQGAEPITFSFNFEFTEAVQSGDEIRVDLRFWDDEAGSNFQGEHVIFLGGNHAQVDPNLTNEWQSLTEENIFSPSGAMYADIRASVNDFTDWSSGGMHFDNFSVSTIPEPGSLALLGAGAGLMLLRRRK